MMNNSNGFQGSSLLGSSTGFKKRPLLRPPSGMLSKKQEFLRSLDISQAEPVIATSLRSEIAAIEQEINLLDKDKKLRQGEGGLQKSYITVLRRWLRDGHTISEKEDDDVKVLKHLGVDSYESGFRKLWKVMGHLDLAITKITELQIVHFLIYDEMFDDIGKDSQRSTNLLSQICNNGFIPGTFQITEVLLDRLKDVYAACKKGSLPKPKEQLKPQDDKKSREETSDLIAQLKSENQKLNAMLEQLIKEKQEKSKNADRNIEDKKTKSAHFIPGNESIKDTFKEIEDKYQEQMRYLHIQKSKAEDNVAQFKSKISSLQAQVKALVDSNSPAPVVAAKAGSYQEALMEQMQKMKRGFERKISVLTQEFTTRERELRKKELQYKSENEKIKWQKSLLLKKFEAFSK